MSTSDCSPELRATVDAMASDTHEKAFRVLDLVLVARSHGGPQRRARARELAAALGLLRRELESTDQATVYDS